MERNDWPTTEEDAIDFVLKNAPALAQPNPDRRLAWAQAALDTDEGQYLVGKGLLDPRTVTLTEKGRAVIEGIASTQPRFGGLPVPTQRQADAMMLLGCAVTIIPFLAAALGVIPPENAALALPMAFLIMFGSVFHDRRPGRAAKLLAHLRSPEFRPTAPASR